MITGSILVFIGLVQGLLGSTQFNVSRMMVGWVIAGIGMVVFATSFVRLP